MSRYEHNSGQHIDDIISRTSCSRHNAPEGYACWYVRYNKLGGDGPAVCNSRIIAAGFNGKIQPSSLRQVSSGGSFMRRR